MKCKLSCMLSLLIVVSLLAACDYYPSASVADTPPTESENFAPSGEIDSDIQATLTFAAWDTAAIGLYDSLDLEGRFQKFYPNVTIEVEQSKDDSEYWQSMRIRASANQLPDIMYNKPFTLSRYKEYLLDLSDVLADEIANNTLAEGYAVSGQVLGLPEKSMGDYIFYWEDLFTSANVEVPTTWEDFLAACQALQNYHGANDADFSAIVIGAKDEWPTYPFTEFMPALISGNGQNWNTMATQDSPFAEGTDINIAYNKLYDLFRAGVCGKDPLGIGHDQAVGLFGQRKAAIIAAGPWALTSIEEAVGDTTGLSTFYLPVRDSTADTFHTIAQGDNFMGVTTHCENPELAIDFVRFYFSGAWYPDYITSIGDDSTMENFPKDKDPVLAAADKKQPDAVVVMYDGGGSDFQAIQAEVKFDYKKLGAQMFIPSFDLNAELTRLDIAWSSARALFDMT